MAGNRYLWVELREQRNRKKRGIGFDEEPVVYS